MGKKIGRLPVMIVTVLAAVAAFFLRRSQLLTQVDETGKLLADAGKGPLTWVCAAFAVLALVYALLLKKQSVMGGRAYTATALTLAAAFVMMVGSVALWWLGGSVLSLLGVITAVCWLAAGLLRQRNTVPSAVLFMIPALICAVELIVQFRDWSRDPVILDYCFSLLACICTMCATFHLGGFSLEKGKRRLTVFYCLCGSVFCAVAMASEAGTPYMLTQCGAALWLLANLWLLLDEE